MRCDVCGKSQVTPATGPIEEWPGWPTRTTTETWAGDIPVTITEILPPEPIHLHNACTPSRWLEERDEHRRFLASSRPPR